MSLGWTVEQHGPRIIVQAQTWEWRLSRLHPGMERLTVRSNGVRVGRVLLVPAHDRVDIVDICVVKEFRGRGIGTHFVGELLAEANGAGVPLRIRVNPDSRFATLCARLGFGDSTPLGADVLLSWTPPRWRVTPA